MTIIVRWEEFDGGDYEVETKFCDTWEQAVEYMKNTNKTKYEIEVDE